MADRQWQDLSNTVLGLALDSVRIQQRLDAAAAQSRERFAALLASVPEQARGFLMPLLPPSLAVKQHNVTCTLRVSTERSLAFELAVKPVNLGLAVLYGSTVDKESSLSVEVRSVCTPDTGTT